MSNATETDRRVIDAYAVALDETDRCHIEPADRPYIARILARIFSTAMSERIAAN